MYSFRDNYETGTAERIARVEFYRAAIDAQIAQKASKAADSRLLNAALTWATTCPDLPTIPEALKNWGPDAPEALPT